MTVALIRADWDQIQEIRQKSYSKPLECEGDFRSALCSEDDFRPGVYFETSAQRFSLEMHCLCFRNKVWLTWFQTTIVLFYFHFFFHFK